MSDADTYLDLAANRRTIYNLTGESTISDAKLEELVKKTLLVTPSAFNTQSARIIVLLGEQHKKLWDIVKAALAPHVAGNAERAAATEAKLNSFQSAYASILFFEDPSTYDPLSSFVTYADKFEAWREQGSGMNQLVLWTALEAAGLGVNVQHYNPLIDDEVKKTWSIDAKWKLIAQMVVGKPEGKRPAAKEQKPLESRYRVIS
ncbi:uncharacterized protein Z520_03116 [Fonsecaea multimorphosa CBS 102226]|uniref:Nitroreductase domain-containing protein n=1 Tax=Fonsecaea multimorphosa CBS 102226 TaxID=1442371 RepID=A0A0D2KXL3_9EURO|nr:uncharacterized protein Z520_03116 [Fonsecaea multimorphosa CBS 102226]KIY01564.1 hypothetical protein Z520_03116 [Fonsecaea multimorphosa CBS 102226]OAL28078.1 hypothetical protein AYO22_03105 [Fonsecaea multimorphosa]